ncbi:MAG TPA: NAD-dependent epimerase/dehydratase family protein [Myxococcaceae bacterium]|nr:NAD-dependent epimerase/dehydratase family protein [Myxococcaceae bacterium]
MKVLVTGGAGFIGSHVCDEFAAHGHTVAALDNLSTGSRQNLSSRIPLIELDIRATEAADYIAKEKPDVICHLAAQMDVRKSVQDPRFDAESNILGTLNLLEAARRVGVKKFIFSSTGGAVYGEQDVFPAPETHPTRPVSPYGASKTAGELYLGYYRAQYGLNFTALRYANVYGPRQNPHGEAGVVAIFAQRLVGGERCTIFGDGGQTRDFVFGKDVARANYLAFERDYVGPVNIGTGIETDINRIYQLLAAAAGVVLPAIHQAAKPGEQRRSCIDPSLAHRVLGWSPTVTLEDGLPQTLAFFRPATAGGPAGLGR